MPLHSHIFVMTGMECGQSCLGLLVLPLVDNYKDHHIKIKTHSVAFAHEFVCFVVKLNFSICDLKYICSMTHKTPCWLVALIGSGSLPPWFGESPKCGSPFLSASPWSLEGQFHKSLLDLNCWDFRPSPSNLVLCIVLDVAMLHWYVSPVSCAELAPCLAKTAASAEHSLATMAFGNSSAGKGATGALATTTAAYRATCRTLQGGYQVTLHHLEVA